MTGACWIQCVQHCVTHHWKADPFGINGWNSWKCLTYLWVVKSFFFSETKKYLGCFICDDLCDNNGIKRQTRCVYTRGIILIKHFRHCNEEVKLTLFRAYCSSFYGCNLGANFTDTCPRMLVVAYKEIYRNFMKCQMLLHYIAQMLAWNIDPFAVINCKLFFGFRKQVLLCDNFIVQTIVSSLHFYSSSLYKEWNKMFFLVWFLF